MAKAICYKLTTQQQTTHGGCGWTPGEWQRSVALGPMCEPGGYHAYSSPLLAVLLNPIHADISDPLLWRAEGDGDSADDHGLKQKYQHLRIVERLELPVFSTAQQVYFAILCTRATGPNGADWERWADRWISGEDRSMAAAEAARARARADAAAWAAWAAEKAAATAWAAEKAAWAAWAAEKAAATAWAAEKAAPGIDLIALAQQAYDWIDPVKGEEE